MLIVFLRVMPPGKIKLKRGNMKNISQDVLGG